MVPDNDLVRRPVDRGSDIRLKNGRWLYADDFGQFGDNRLREPFARLGINQRSLCFGVDVAPVHFEQTRYVLSETSWPLGDHVEVKPVGVTEYSRTMMRLCFQRDGQRVGDFGLMRPDQIDIQMLTEQCLDACG
ncbi:MAG TPA: hypothetical protein DIC52_20940 [Candidatus Latescibacteria bacterium]|nr:hypothetical protein [Candidatus Latescibacterota bacterium]